MFYSKSVYEWIKLLKESLISIEDEVKSDRPTIVSTAEIVDSVYALILADKRVKIEDISEQLGIFMVTTHKIVHDELAFSKISTS